MYRIKSSTNLQLGEFSIDLLDEATKLFAKGDYQQTEKLLIALLKTQPNNIKAIRLLSQLGIRLGAYKKVIPLLEKCILSMPNDPILLLQLAQIEAECNLSDMADHHYQTLVKLFPNWSDGYFAYAGFLQSFGHFNQAKNNLEQTLKLDPKHAGAYLAIVNLMSMENEGQLTQQIESALSELTNCNNKNLDQMKLFYALGKAKADQLDYRSAFENWKKANAIQLNLCDFRVEQMYPFYQQLEISFKEAELAEKRNAPNESKLNKMTPIFIVGLPRSGSTLLAQMLSSHSEIESAGEVNYISNDVVHRLQQMTGKHYPLNVNELNDGQLIELREIYCEKLKQHYPKSRYIIDKLPANFQSIGLIKKILPNAIIVNIDRKAEAVALSIISNYFAENEPYFCNLNELAKYYLSYKKLMSFWIKQDRGNIINMSYENLVNDPQKKITQILERCGLDWQDACSNHHLQTNKITTLSDKQIRKPIYKSSINNWKNYREFLSEFSQTIAKF
ncbi:MAG: hypothetical protein COB38_10365 [Gammaproteobacteria bacterium]|nr:MAG: hypothetical protein COB38_10365 [Gammaproteobacteria bacterium]